MMKTNKDYLKSFLSDDFPKKEKDQFAVGIFIDFEKTVPEIFFIERARFNGDHWSGDIAFPGGKKEESDDHILDTAIRETKEEIGVRAKESQHLLGYHKSIGLKKRGRPVKGDLHSFIFAWDESFKTSLSEEVEDLFSLDLNYLSDPLNLSEKSIQRENISIKVPGIRYQDHIIWGLTYSLLVDVLYKLKPDLKLPIY